MDALTAYLQGEYAEHRTAIDHVRRADGKLAAPLEVRVLHAGDGLFAGWEFDHPPTGDRRHPVPTAQAVGFPLGDTALLEHHGAARALRAARFLPRGLGRSTPGAAARAGATTGAATGAR
jgi:hypothetical protein